MLMCASSTVRRTGSVVLTILRIGRAGGAQSSTQITLSSTANLTVGTLINLDQLSDTTDDGSIYQAADPTKTCINCNVPGRSNRPQNQIVRAVAISGNTVTIAPGLYMPNWRADRSPGAWWSSDTPISGSGVEDLSIDSNGVSSGGGIITFYNASGCWVRGFAPLNARDHHVLFWQSARNTVRDSYFYGNQLASSQSYGTGGYLSSDNLIENNIFQHVTVPMMNETTQGEVFGYNFSIDDHFGDDTWAMASSFHHAPGNNYSLWEGNDGFGLILENFHGPAQFITGFRNRWSGWETRRTSQTVPVIAQSYNRFANIIGNVLGTSTHHTNYTSKFGDAVNPSLCNRSIFALGWGRNCEPNSPGSCAGLAGCPLDDPVTIASLMRWGNYDTVTRTVRWVASEVPSGLSRYANPVPAGQSLPASLYLSGKPSWFGGTPWPAIGPDVTGGNVPNVDGFAHKIPARVCFESTPTDASGYLAFNAAACYGTSTPGPTPPAPPTNLRVIP